MLFCCSQCTGETECHRQNAYYWQCLNGNGGGWVPPVVPDVAPVELPRYLQCGAVQLCSILCFLYMHYSLLDQWV